VLEWNPILAPAGIAPDMGSKLVAAVARAMGDAEALARVRDQGARHPA